MVELDEMDRRILSALQDHPKLSAEEMAAKVGLSHTPLWRRMKRLEDEGVIVGRITVLDPKALGLPITVIANIRLRQHDEDTLEALEHAVEHLPEVVECYSMSGDSDYLVKVVASSIDEYEHFLKKTLVHLPGVASVSSHFALKRVKATSRLPIPAASGKAFRP